MTFSHRAHGLLDYVFAFLVAASPWLFGFSDQRQAVDIAVACGIGTAFYSLITNYEMGLIGLVPFNGHRLADLAVGVLLAGSSWHFAMKGIPAVVFTILGLLFLTMLCMTPRLRQDAMANSG